MDEPQFNQYYRWNVYENRAKRKYGIISVLSQHELVQP